MKNFQIEDYIEFLLKNYKDKNIEEYNSLLPEKLQNENYILDCDSMKKEITYPNITINEEDIELFQSNISCSRYINPENRDENFNLDICMKASLYSSQLSAGYKCCYFETTSEDDKGINFCWSIPKLFRGNYGFSKIWIEDYFEKFGTGVDLIICDDYKEIYNLSTGKWIGTPDTIDNHDGQGTQDTPNSQNIQVTQNTPDSQDTNKNYESFIQNNFLILSFISIIFII